jgi:hypothetical protein
MCGLYEAGQEEDRQSFPSFDIASRSVGRVEVHHVPVCLHIFCSRKEFREQIAEEKLDRRLQMSRSRHYSLGLD